MRSGGVACPSATCAYARAQFEKDATFPAEQTRIARELQAAQRQYDAAATALARFEAESRGARAWALPALCVAVTHGSGRQ